MNAIDILDRLPAELAARLATDAFFANIPIVVADKGNVAAEYQRQQAVITDKGGKRGVCVVVLQLTANDLNQNLQFGPMTLFPAFQVVENRELNSDESGTGLSAIKVARRLRDTIKNFNVRGMIADMKAATPCIDPLKIADMGDAVVAYQVNFECLEVSTEDQRQVQEVVFTGVPPTQVALSCPTVGAAIWFTTDDSFPYNGTADDYPGSTSQLYSAALDVPPGGLVLRAAAYLDGQFPSGINRATIINNS